MPEDPNPFSEPGRLEKMADACILVIFGATGDLTARKLIPALYNLAVDGLLPTHFACVGFARRDKTHEQFREEMRVGIEQHSRTQPIDPNVWTSFKEQIFYHRSQFDDDAGYEGLRNYLEDLDKRYHTKGNRVFYLSTPPSYFPLIIGKLGQHNLIYEEEQEKWSHVIIEKPFGHDLSSAVSLQKEIGQTLKEDQIYRIDHYLGKETVQNLLTFRFSNPIFESLWNNHHIEHVQIAVSEDIGIGTRGHFWEEAGLLRDIVQNHMMQLLSLVAMEPPTSLQANAIRDEKVKVVESIRPFAETDVVRGQYEKGYIQGEEVKGYRQEADVDPHSSVETFLALKLAIDNWRWSGVPFYLRAGKRLPKRTSEIAIYFYNAPGFLFGTAGKKVEPNVLVIRIQPDEGIALKMNCKVPGINGPIKPVKMDFHYGSYFGQSPPEAYERLICDCMAGDNTLFARADELFASWKLFTPILESWQKGTAPPVSPYPSGTWGPKEADDLIQRDQHKWRIL